MRIGELAHRTGTTTRALRYYEERGLLQPSRAPGGYRDFDEDAVVRVGNIRDLVASGFTLADVRSFLAFLDRPLPDRFRPAPICGDALTVAARRLSTLDGRIAALTALRDRLAERLPEVVGAAATGPAAMSRAVGGSVAAPRDDLSAEG
ncbi:MerR family transcriptional regulator [Frankia sp. QA3]|uniref:MerR family transcriptional regulator n=1 Tax=Frankia sp. QA3 TaxID=710111 RepID=UPI000269C5E0|nr:MerR family transcriptional regulator [Frankia sp. QA3]EIV93538.1 putative transcriptional regulator [Frankia sp. QA3]